MNFFKHTSKLKELSSGTVSAQLNKTTYRYIELADATIIREVTVMHGLDSKLNFAIKNGETVELHFVQKGASNALIALKIESGKCFISNPSAGLSSALVSFFTLLIVAVISGFMFGIIGFLVMLAPSTFVWLKLIKPMLLVKKYLESIPNALII